MTLNKVLHRTRVHITGSWKKSLMMHPLSSIARRIHLFAGSAGNSEHRLGPGESRPSPLRCNWESPVRYGQFHRRSDGFRSGSREHQAAIHHV